MRSKEECMSNIKEKKKKKLYVFNAKASILKPYMSSGKIMR